MTSDLDHTKHELYMQRCLQLARLGHGYVAPNPMVGAVLVYGDVTIGEGYHQKYGEAHAEVNCLQQAVQNGHEDKFAASTLYVSLEPCAHFGKTPPCADLIIKNKIARVVIACADPFKAVDGKGIEKLKAAGAEVKVGLLENESRELNKRFFTFHTKRRPYIILKWAQTEDGKIAGNNGARLLISNEKTNTLVHKWRSEESSILVGTNTALADDPELTNRFWPGPSPIRLVVDMNLRLPSTLKIFNGEQRTILFNALKNEETANIYYYQISKNIKLVPQITEALYLLNIQSVLIEGGAVLLKSFIDEDLWDEARIITNTTLRIGDGITSPVLHNKHVSGSEKIKTDIIKYYSNQPLNVLTNQLIN